MHTTRRGFTLIELVVVITILGILAAFAIPRFTQLENEARAAAITGLSASVRSSAELAHARYLAIGTTPSSVTMEGQTVTLANGYPDVPGVQLALQDTTGFTVTGTATTVTYSIVSATTPAGCSFVYTVSAADGSLPTYGPLTTGGC